jgi:CarD family transcriptional regulator
LYQIGQLIVYASEGVCRVEAIGPLDMRGAQKNVAYYTLSSLYHAGKIFVPVDSAVFMRPIITKAEAEQLICAIPGMVAAPCETNNPRLLNEHYQAILKNYQCHDLIRLIRGIYKKGQEAEARGRRLGQVDERCMKRAEELLHGELAAALDIQPQEVGSYIACRLTGTTE